VAVDKTRTFKPINIAVLTVSDTRGPEDDTSGDILAQRVSAAGHNLAGRAIEKDDVPRITSRINTWIDDRNVDCIIITGGTGLTGRDVTPEALERIKEADGGRDIPGFGELFRWLSFQTIGTSTIQSRACAIVARGTYVFALPGSNGAVKDGWDGILKEQLDSRNRPCNFVELMPRLREV
jgi:molybdopterin adenylyltransferase